MTPVVRSVLLAGGGTAGHVNPLLAVADELRRRDPSVRIAVLGTATGLEADLVPARGYRLVEVPRVPLPRRPTPDWFRLPGRLRAAVRAAGQAIDDAEAQVVVGFGGYVSTPAYLAARRRGVPVVVHEQNARPGLANRLGARWARAVAVTFPQTPLPRAQVTGLPLRPAVADLVRTRSLDATGARAEAAHALGLDPALPTVLVTGGSLGALSLNSALGRSAGDLLAAGAQVLHLTGAGKDEAVRADVARALAAGAAGSADAAGSHGTAYDPGRYQVRAYLAEMELALAAADLVVCRAGAGTVSELAALGLPAVYVPLPIGNGEQRLNARGVVEAGGGLLVADADLSPEWVRRTVLPLLADAPRLARMGQAAAAVGVTDGAARVAELVTEAVADAAAEAARPR